jgi:hypothetical protein
MKKAQFLLAVCMVLCNSALCQNWRIIEPGVYYNYSVDSIITATIWIDSTFQINQDTVFVLNKVSSICEGCERKGSWAAVYLKNQPSILQFKIIKKENGDYNLRDTANYLIKSDIEPDSTWLFDSLNYRYAVYLRNGYMHLFDDIADSVKFFKIANTDTLIISKHYGIIKIPDFKGNHFKLAGVEGKLLKGKRNLYFKDFINPGIGDVFQYSISTGGRFPGYEEIQKHKVQSIEKNEDSIIVRTLMLSKKILYDFYSPRDTVYTSSENKLSYYKSAFKFLDNFNFQNIFDTNPTKVDFDSTFECISKSYSTNGIVMYGDTLYSTYNPSIKDDIEYYNLGYKIGLLDYSHTFNHNGPYSNYVYKKLQGYNNGKITYGHIYNDSFFQSEISSDTNSLQFSILPTLFSDSFEIQFVEIVNKVSIKIYDLAGRVRYSDELYDLESIIIKPIGLEKGIYILKVDVPDKDQIVKKIVKI